MKKFFYGLPYEIEVDGEKYAINTDFSVWVEVEHILFSRKFSDGETLARVLALVFPVLPHNPEEAIRGLLWFYSAGEDCETGGDRTMPAYDPVLDFEYIWGAFLAEFGIDLCDCKMHWWKFKALLSCLGENCRFSQIVGYRTVDLSQIETPERRAFYRKMKKKFNLPDNRTERERDEEVAEAFINLF